jgi:glycosyltransferase involved in cell wall biosynthesis
MVSVCMATYNGEKYIKEQISSILLQLAGGDELVISDDQSNDNTVSIIESFGDKRIRLFLNSKKKGVINNFENALANAKGDFIFLSDQDDIWFPDKVAECLLRLENYNLVVSNCEIVDGSLNVINTSYFKALNAGSGLIRNLKKNTFLGCCICFDKALLKLVLPFPSKIPMHDIWIGFTGTLFGKVKFYDKVLMQYRRHDFTVTHQTVGKSKDGIIKKVQNRINQLKYIPLLMYRRYIR